MQIPLSHCAFGPQGEGLHGSTTAGLTSGGFGWQKVNGSPVKPSGHVHIGVWFITLQTALEPHEPGQGSLHISLMQAKLLGHSELTEHSGLQFGGLPKKFGKQEQEGAPPRSLH